MNYDNLRTVQLFAVNIVKFFSVSSTQRLTELCMLYVQSYFRSGINFSFSFYIILS